MNQEPTSTNAQAADPSASAGHYPGDTWEFDQAVTRVFTDMLERSIPGLSELRELTFDLGGRIVKTGDQVIDLGCSRGGSLALFLKKHGAALRYYRVDRSRPMIEAAREDYAGWVAAKILSFDVMDISKAFPVRPPAGLILSILTLQFVRIEDRPRILRQAFNALRSGGALLIAEKTLGSELLEGSYLDFKRRSYSEDEIAAKKAALAGVLVPVKPEWLEGLLAEAGFVRVERYWSNRLFAAWVAFKP